MDNKFGYNYENFYELRSVTTNSTWQYLYINLKKKKTIDQTFVSLHGNEKKTTHSVKIPVLWRRHLSPNHAMQNDDPF